MTGFMYMAHLHCLAVQAGFYSEVVECLLHMRRVACSFRVRAEDIFLRL